MKNIFCLNKPQVLYSQDGEKHEEFWGKFMKETGITSDGEQLYDPIFVMLVPGLWLRESEVHVPTKIEMAEFAFKMLKRKLRKTFHK